MDIENQKVGGNRLTKIRQKKRSVFASLDDQPSNFDNQIKLDETPTFNLHSQPQTIQTQNNVPSIIKEHSKQLQNKINNNYSKFVKNQMYYGQFSYNQTYDYNPKQQNISTKQSDLILVQQSVDTKKDRKFKRKKKESNNNFQEIKLNDQLQIKNNEQVINFPEVKQCIIPSNQKQINIFEFQEEKNQYQSKSKHEGSSKILLRLESVTKPPYQNQQSQESQNSDEIGINSITALLGINHDITTLKPMMYAELPKNATMKCYIRRASAYKLSLELYLDDNRFLMKSESQNASIGCNHYISLSSEINKNNQSYLGKLRSDFLGAFYSIYDSGISDKQLKSISSVKRMCMGNIQYQNNILGVKGPRKIKVIVPNPSIADKSVFRIKDKQSLQSSLKQSNQSSLIMLNNKKPVWSEKLKTYALNFGGRVKMPSIKNFILQSKQGEPILTFGKVSSNIFTLEFKYPLSPFQAFGIAMSSFDFKFSCQ